MRTTICTSIDVELKQKVNDIIKRDGLKWTFVISKGLETFVRQNGNNK